MTGHVEGLNENQKGTRARDMQEIRPTEPCSPCEYRICCAMALWIQVSHWQRACLGHRANPRVGRSARRLLAVKVESQCSEGPSVGSPREMVWTLQDKLWGQRRSKQYFLIAAW